MALILFQQINRNKNKWKFHLKDGIMNLNGKDFVFQKATGDAEWWYIMFGWEGKLFISVTCWQRTGSSDNWGSPRSRTTGCGLWRYVCFFSNGGAVTVTTKFRCACICVCVMSTYVVVYHTQIMVVRESIITYIYIYIDNDLPIFYNLKVA